MPRNDLLRVAVAALLLVGLMLLWTGWFAFGDVVGRVLQRHPRVGVIGRFVTSVLALAFLALLVLYYREGLIEFVKGLR